MRDLCEVTEPRSHCSCRDMMGSSDDLNAAMDGYILFRKDKPAMWGGGTALFVREKLECIELFLGLYEKHEKRGWVRIQGKATWIILLWVFATSQATRNRKLDFYNHLEGASLTGHGGELQPPHFLLERQPGTQCPGGSCRAWMINDLDAGLEGTLCKRANKNKLRWDVDSPEGRETLRN